MRSYYLDDMDVQPGDKVVCKANLAADWIEQGAVFTVLAFAVIQSTSGVVYRHPSARFQKVIEDV